MSAPFFVTTLLACYDSLGPAFAAGPPPTVTDGFLVPVALVSSGDFGTPGSSNAPAAVAVTPFTSSTAVAALVGPTISFRYTIGVGGQIGGRRFRPFAAWTTVAPLGGAGSTGRLNCTMQIVDSVGTVIYDLTPTPLLGVAQALDAAATYKEVFAPVSLPSMNPNEGYELVITYQLEIDNAAAGNVDWSLENGASSAGVCGVEVDSGGL